MQVSSHADVPNSSGGQLVTTVGINGGHATASTLLANAAKPSISFENVDPSNLDDDDSDSDGADGLALQQQLHINQTLQNIPNALSGPKPGKKTKGRVKIKMEFIENKLRRYTTFSKRKTGIMKKAYELSTLTGTQVMLLVASETGHVYTFATRKLQPMITSESGKALIQTCLNSPDPPPFSPGQQQAVEQRMNPSGFEETELTCAVGEEDSKAGIQMIPESLGKPMFQMQGMVSAETSLQTSQASVMSTQQSVQSAASTAASTAPTVAAGYVQQHVTSGSTVSATPAVQTTKATTSPAAASNISMQLPAGLIFQSGTPITIPIQQGTSGGTSQQQTVYRLPSNQIVSVAGGQFATSTTEASPPTVSSASSSSTQSNITMVPDGLLSGSTASVSGGALTPGIVMYHTPQGVVYATPTATLQDRTIFNFQQPATAISVPQQDQQVGSGGQQIITIPVPVSVAANSGQVFHLAAAAPESGAVEVAQPPVKKSRK